MFFADSFDQYADVGEVSQNWVVGSFASLVTGRSGSGKAFQSWGETLRYFPNSYTVTAGFAVNEDNGARLLTFSLPYGQWYQAYHRIDLNMDDAGRLYFTFDGQYGSNTSSEGVMTTGEWYYVEVAAGSYWGASFGVARVNGEEVLSASYYHGDYVHNGLTVVALPGYYTRVDDFYMITNYDFVGESTSGRKYLNRDGSVLEWDTSEPTPAHYMLLEEYPYDQQDYIYTESIEALDLWGFEPVPSSCQVKHVGVRLAAVPRPNDSGMRIQLVTLLSGELAEGPAKEVAADDIIHTWDMRTNPVTGGAFSPLEVNDMQIGVRRIE